jgi:O-antigen/teichoic acid export membrane protein
VIDEKDRSTVFWVGLVVGTLLMLAGVMLAGPISAIYREPAVKPLMAALSASFLITALGATQRVVLIRAMDFRRIEFCVVAGVFAGGLVGLAIAMMGLGPWAIVAQQLTIAAVTAAGLWLASRWRPRFTFSRASLRSLGGYGANVLGTRVTYYGQESALPLIIGRSLGASALGVFSIAYVIVLAPMSRLAIPIGEVLWPAFTRMQENRERLAEFWVGALRVLAALCMPAVVGLVIVAPEFVAVVLGDKWSAAVPVIRVLAWVGLLQSLQAWNGGILMSLGKADVLFRAILSFFFVYVVAFVIGAQWGIEGVAVAYAIAATAVETVYLWLTTSTLQISYWTPLRALAGVVQATIVMGVGVVGLDVVLDKQTLSPALRLVTLVAVGVVIYLPVLAWRAPAVTAEIRSLRNRRLTPIPVTTPVSHS